MLRSYLKIALRNIRRERSYAIINIAGLAIGLAICLLVMAYVVDEWSFDNFHANGSRIYRVNKAISETSGVIYDANTPFPLSDLIVQEIPEVETALQVIPMAGVMVSANGNSFHQMLTLADPQFFEVFTFPLLSGDRATALADQSSAVLSQSFASRLFGTTEAIGKTLSISWGGKVNDFTVSAVAKEVPANSSVEFQIVVSKAAMNRFFGTAKTWNTSWPETYVLTRVGSEADLVEQKINSAVHFVPKEKGTNRDLSFALQPIRDIHLNPDIQGGAPNANSPIYSYLLCLIGFFILELACINFTTLAIGRAQHRIKEIGARKVMGATGKQIVIQVLGETVIVAAISMVLAFALAELALPHFGTLAGKTFHSIVQSTGWWALLAVWLVLIAAVFAGGYPALILSRANSVDAVRGKATFLSGRIVMRVLVVLQFCISAGLIAVTLSMSSQLQFMINSPLGFNRDALVLLRLDGTGPERLASVGRMREALSTSNDILSVAASSADFTGGGVRMGNRVGPDSIELSVFLNPVDHEYVHTMGLKVVQGTDFTSSEKDPNSPTNVLVNETFVKTMQWDDPLGKEAPLLQNSRIIGVIQDYHIQPFTSKIEPIALVETTLGDDWSENLQFAVIRLDPNRVSAAMKKIEETWRTVAPNMPFDYEFMEAHIEAQYRSYLRWAEIMKDAAILAVVIACFGVFGLTALALAKRRKEIGIRKILGANSVQLVAMFYREFAVLAIVGSVIAWPVAYWYLNSWLAEFAYRNTISAWPFVIGIAMLLAVVIATVLTQAIRASAGNISEVIRYE